MAMFNVRLVCQGYSTTEGQGLWPCLMYVLYVRAIVPRKGFKALVRAIAMFNVRLVCQGYSTTEGQGLWPCLMYVLYVRAIDHWKARVYGHV